MRKYGSLNRNEKILVMNRIAELSKTENFMRDIVSKLAEEFDISISSGTLVGWIPEKDYVKLKLRGKEVSKKKAKIKQQERYRNNRDRDLKRSKEHHKKIKELIFDHYGRQCACPLCDVNDIRFLTIDHINNDGDSHRAELKRGGNTNFYHWLYKQYVETGKWPEDLQTLCFNCNLGKNRNGGICPHEDPL